MFDDYLVGDLIRPKAVQKPNAPYSRLYKPWFLKRRPALVLNRTEFGKDAPPMGIIAYRRENRTWVQSRLMNLTWFDVVARPAASPMLNRFHPYKPPAQRRSISIGRHKKCVVSVQWAYDTSTCDPDHPIMYAALPMSPAQLGAYVRHALSNSSCHTHIRNDSLEVRKEYIASIHQKAGERSAALKSQLKAEFGVEADKVLNSHSVTRISSTFDCLRLSKAQMVDRCAMDIHVGYDASNDELGRAVLEMFDRPLLKQATFDAQWSYLVQLMPYLEPAILDAWF